jgi:hypothetical protein
VKEKEGQEFITDGASLSYSPVRLFEGSMPAPEEKKPPLGVYGPVDDGIIKGPQTKGSVIAPFGSMWSVKTKKLNRRFTEAGHGQLFSRQEQD